MPQMKPMVFGGIFEHENIFSENKRCADGFDEYPFFNNLKICLGQYDFNVLKKGVIFDGMRSCHDEDQSCGPGLNRILLTTIDNCPYYQCANIAFADAVESHQGLLKPPYIDRDLAMSKTRYSYRHELEELEKDDDWIFSEEGDRVGKIAS